MLDLKSSTHIYPTSCSVGLRSGLCSGLLSSFPPNSISHVTSQRVCHMSIKTLYTAMFEPLSCHDDTQYPNEPIDLHLCVLRATVKELTGRDCLKTVATNLGT